MSFAMYQLLSVKFNGSLAQKASVFAAQAGGVFVSSPRGRATRMSRLRRDFQEVRRIPFFLRGW